MHSKEQGLKRIKGADILGNSYGYKFKVHTLLNKHGATKIKFDSVK